MTPKFSANGVEIYHGDCREVLRELPDESVHCVVTSPPYWGLRDYGTGQWEGGLEECDHQEPISLRRDSPGGFHNSTSRGTQPATIAVAKQYGNQCGKCGATRIDRQIGLEDSPIKYISTMRGVFAEVRRVLRSDGTLWLNMGDSYAARLRQSGPEHAGELTRSSKGVLTRITRDLPPTLKEKDLVGIPWMLAFALREDGWYLRQDIIWAKPNPMPESVTDRCTKAHEYLFLLSKSERYYFNQEAIKEAALDPNDDDRRISTATLDGKSTPDETRNGIRQKKINKPRGWATGDDHTAVGWATAERQGSVEPRYDEEYEISGKRNRRSVWNIRPQAFPEAHFATFPEDLIKPCILAGCVEGGTVLDPFMGSGTTGLVARKLHCKAIGIELNEDYIEIASRRLSQEVFQF